VPSVNAIGELIKTSIGNTYEPDLYSYWIPQGERFTDYRPFGDVAWIDANNNGIVDYGENNQHIKPERYIAGDEIPAGKSIGDIKGHITYSYTPIITGYEFLGWTRDVGWEIDINNKPTVPILGVNEDPKIQMGESGPINLYAVFRQKKFTVEFRAIDISNNGAEVPIPNSSASFNRDGMFYFVSPNNLPARTIALLEENDIITNYSSGRYFYGWTPNMGSDGVPSAYVYKLARQMTV
jgi:hypothetical protein